MNHSFKEIMRHQVTKGSIEHESLQFCTAFGVIAGYIAALITLGILILIF